MDQNETRTLWISIGSALFAVFLLYSYSQEKKAEYDRRYGSLKPVVVAAQDIGSMMTITEDMLDTVERPVDFIEPAAVTTLDELVGQVSVGPIREGQQIQGNDVIAPGPATGLALQVSPNKRAVSLPIDEVSGVSKLIKPGDRVDLLIVLTHGNGANAVTEVKTLAQDIPVLATGLNVRNNLPRLFELGARGDVSIRRLINDTDFNTITLEVDPQQAQEILMVLNSQPKGLYFSLRNPNDRVITRLPATNAKSVLAKGPTAKLNSRPRRPRPKSPPPAPKPPPKPKRKSASSGGFKEVN